MKLNILGALIMCVVAINPSTAFANTKDEARIKTIIESVGLFADTGDFEELELLYAPEVEMDYTSLAGGEVEIKSPQRIMTEWAGVLPGFDRTRHEVSNIVVSSNGETATATADITAGHWVNDLFWEVKGDYVYRLANNDGRWQITAHKLNLKGEEGTRDVFGPAIENANANPPTYIKRQQTRQAVIDMLTALESKDMDKFSSVWADDAVQDMPYSPEGFPKRVNGKKAIVELYAQWPETSGATDFTSQLIFYPMIDAEMVFVEFKGNVDVIPTGRNYKQNYGGLYHVENGKIKLYREYYDPEPFKYTFGLAE